MDWHQELLNSQVNINRAVFEMNRPGYQKTSPAYKADPDKKYVLEQINEAITSLQDSSRQLTEIVTGQREIDFYEREKPK